MKALKVFWSTGEEQIFTGLESVIQYPEYLVLYTKNEPEIVAPLYLMRTYQIVDIEEVTPSATKTSP